MKSLVFSKNAQYPALNSNLSGGNENGFHLGIGGLKPDHVAFGVETLQSGFRAMHERNDDFALTGSPGTLHEDVIAIDDGRRRTGASLTVCCAPAHLRRQRRRPIACAGIPCRSRPSRRTSSTA